eukprot:2929022-Prymnesium_polylepis.1
MRSPPVWPWCTVRRYQALRALCGALWHEVGVVERTGSPPCAVHVGRSAPTRPRLCRDGSSVGASSTGCWAGQCAGAAGTCAGASGRSSGAAAGRGA